MVKLFCAIVGVGGSGFEVDIDDGTSVAALKKAIKKENKNKLKSVDAGELQLFLAKKDGAWLQSEDLLRMWEKKIPERDYMIEELKDPVAKIRAKILSELPDGSIHVLVVVPMDDSERRWEELLSSLARENPERLCGSSGCDWAYQGASELVETLKDPLVTHYKAWQVGNKDKRNHPLHLVLSGPGTGKSRMLDEMKNLLCAAAIESKDQALVGRMNSAYMFRVTFENGTQATGSLLNRDIPEYDISYRMLYQLSTGEKPWGDFVHSLKMYPQKHISIESVISILAKREGVDVKNMTVILCVDGLQMLVSDGTKTCDFCRVMSSICGFLNSSTAFAVCVCSATIEKPVRKALVDSPQNRLYLVPPALCGEKVLETRTPIKKLLVRDMGGHGRALETLDSVCRKLKVGEEEINPGYVVDKVNGELQLAYPGLFDSRVFKPDTCKELVSAIISQRQYDVTDIIGKTSLTVDELRSFGLFRLTSEGRLECAFIFLVELIRMMPKLKGELTNFDDHITRSVTAWQHFECFVGFYRQVKSIAFRETPLLLSEFHAGARFGKIDGVMITEPSPRELVQALHQHGTKSSSGVSVVTTDQLGDVMVSDMKTIIINGTSASAGDLFMTVELTSGGQQVKCNEVIQCKFLHTKAKFKEDTYAEEREKAVDGSDVFLLITSSSVDEFDLPPRCGIVSKEEFHQYFGPFASRAFRSLLAPPDINEASSTVLLLIEGLGIKTVEKIVKERKKRKFSDVEDAVNRVCSNKKCKTAEVIRRMYSDFADVEAYMHIFSQP